MMDLQIDCVTKRFGPHLAVDDLSLSVEPGQVFGLLGPNGAGKTTTIRMILRMFLPDSGEIRIGGEPVTDDLKRSIGYLPEERGLYRRMKTGEHLEYLALLRGLDPAVARERTWEYLDRLGLADYARRRVEELSKGMQQKVQFAAAVIHDPALVILDEPFSGLDPINAQLLVDWIGELKARGVTILLSAHQMETVERLCEHIGLINRGKLLLAGELREIKRSLGRSRVRLEVHGASGYEPGGESVLLAERTERGWDVDLREGDDGQALLGEAMAAGTVERFERIEPTLHEIFVRLVGGAGEIDVT